jgi:hypothetical protein
MKRFVHVGVVLGCALIGAGCVYTVPGGKLPPIEPGPGDYKPNVEQTVGDFSFTLDGGKMITSNYAGRELNKALLDEWVKRGWVRRQTYVKSSQFSNAADYNVTLSGTMYGESSVFLQVLSGLTLNILPYTVTQNYDVQFLVEEVRSGAKYSAAVEETYKAYVQLFLLLALPWGQDGAREAHARMAEHVFAQLLEQGAFRLEELPVTGERPDEHGAAEGDPR